MAKKFGPFLVEQKKISIDQLNEAHQAQVVLGGRLGTNLVELGFITLNDLTEQLSRFSGFPSPPDELLNNISKQTLAAIPKALIERHRVLPIKMDSKQMIVGMLDPTDPLQLDELAFATGRKVRPCIIPELRMFYWLEFYYVIKRDPRYINIDKDLKNKPWREKKPVVEESNKPEQALFAELTDEQTFQDIYSEKSIPKAAPLKMEATTLPATVSPTSPAQLSARESIHSLEERLKTAQTREEIMGCVLFLCHLFADVVAIFLVHKDMIQGSSAKGGGLEDTAMNGILLPLQSENMLSSVILKNEMFRGAPPNRTEDGILLNAMKRKGVVEALVLPVRIRERIVNLLYADSGAQPMSSLSVAALTTLASELGKAYERLILSRKR